MTLPQLSLDRNDHDDERCSRVALLSLDHSSKYHIEGVDPVTWLGAWSLDANMETLDIASHEDGSPLSIGILNEYALSTSRERAVLLCRLLGRTRLS